MTARLRRASDVDLAALVALGYDPAFAELSGRYDWLARSLAAKYRIPGTMPDDVEQEARVALHRACLDFKPALSVPFGPFASLCAERAVLTALKTATRKKHLAMNTADRLERPLDDNGVLGDVLTGPERDDPFSTLERRQTLHAIASAARTLTDVERVSLGGVVAGETYAAIASSAGVSPKTVDNAVQRARRKLHDALDGGRA